MNPLYAYAGSVGPDLYYFTGASEFSVLSDLAHYCKTDVLAAKILDQANRSGKPKLRALAYGWISHNVADSAAHPWVNGFVGSAFQGALWRGAIPGQVNQRHGALEIYVAETYSQMPASVFTQAVYLYANDPDVAALLGEAFELTYGDVFAGSFTCAVGNGPSRSLITAVNVREATVRAGKSMAALWNAALPSMSLLGPRLLEQLPVITTTAKEYLALTRGFTGKAWDVEKAPRGFNLDIGINAQRQELSDIYGPLSAAFARASVFNTPGTAFVPPNGDIPQFVDRCSALRSQGQVCFTRAGGDTPDDNASLGTPGVIDQLPRVQDLERAAWRLALKKGARWPALGAQVRQLVKQADSANALGQWDAAVEIQERIRDLGAAEALSSTEFQELYFNAGRPNASGFFSAADVQLVENGFADSTSPTVEGFEEPTLWVSPNRVRLRLDQHPVLLVGSGGLYGLAQNEEFRAKLESYVAAGGTLVVFAQQRGSDFSVLPTPNGVPIHGYGWFEDNSCYTNGAYIDQFHPILASQSQSLVTSNLDGYFDSIPENAIVLLRRAKNGRERA